MTRRPVLLLARKTTAILFGIFFAATAINIFIKGLANEMGFPHVLFIALFGLLTFGLLTSRPPFLKVTAWICLFAAIALPVGVINPLEVSDYMAAGLQPPELTDVLIRIVPLDIFLLGSAFLLDLPIQDKPSTGTSI